MWSLVLFPSKPSIGPPRICASTCLYLFACFPDCDVLKKTRAGAYGTQWQGHTEELAQLWSLLNSLLGFFRGSPGWRLFVCSDDECGRVTPGRSGWLNCCNVWVYLCMFRAVRIGYCKRLRMVYTEYTTAVYVFCLLEFRPVGNS